MQASEWYNWDHNTRIIYLCNIASEAMKLETAHEGQEIQYESIKGIIAGWIGGKTPLEILVENQILEYDNLNDLSKFIENF